MVIIDYGKYKRDKRIVDRAFLNVKNNSKKVLTKTKNSV